MKFKNVIVLMLICSSVLISSLSGCAWPRRSDLIIDEIENTNVTYPYNVTVLFSEVIPGKPLKETVWDNVNGPFWDQKESQQIGFTQNYQVNNFLIPPAMLPLMAAAPDITIDTQIIIPFGNIFSSVFESGVKRTFKGYKTCFTERSPILQNSENLLQIEVDSFYVWEYPLNHINFYVKGDTLFTKNDQIVKIYSFEKKFLQKKVGGIFNTHKSFIKEMNRLANVYAKEITVEILQNSIN
jgi:hypothetical protein